MQSELNTAGVMWGCVEANTCDWEGEHVTRREVKAHIETAEFVLSVSRDTLRVRYSPFCNIITHSNVNLQIAHYLLGR